MGAAGNARGGWDGRVAVGSEFRNIDSVGGQLLEAQLSPLYNLELNINEEREYILRHVEETGDSVEFTWALGVISRKRCVAGEGGQALHRACPSPHPIIRLSTLMVHGEGRQVDNGTYIVDNET